MVSQFLADIGTFSPAQFRPCALIVPKKLVPVATVSWAKTTGSTSAPCSGSMKNTAPLLVSIPCVSVHASKSSPIELSAPGVWAGPSMPMVRYESYWLSGLCDGDACRVSATGKRDGSRIEKASQPHHSEECRVDRADVRAEGRRDLVGRRDLQRVVVGPEERVYVARVPCVESDRDLVRGVAGD